MPEIRSQAKIENLEKLIRFVSACAERQGLAPERIQEVELATEEALVNIMNYAYPEETGDVEVRCGPGDNSRLLIEILDTGIPFNPLSLGEPDINEEILDRKIGGLGVFLIRKIIDEVRYRRDGEMNIFSFIIHK